MFAREEPPPNLAPTERLAWFEAQCTKLTAEVDDLESRRREYEELDAAGTRLSERIRLPSGKLMYHELQALDREVNQHPADRERILAYNAMRADYAGRMTALIPEERDLTRRGIRNFDELKARHQAAKAAWGPVEGRYPLAKSERDWACEERERAQKERIAARRSTYFRVRIEWSGDVDVGVGAAIVRISLQPYLSDISDFDQARGVKLTLYSIGGSKGAKIGISGLGNWSEFEVNSPMRAEDFRGVTGGISCGPGVTFTKWSIGTPAILSFAIPSGTVNVPVTTGGGISFSICSFMAGQWG